MAKKPVSLSKGSKNASYEEADDDDDNEDWVEEKEETATMSTKEADTHQDRTHQPHADRTEGKVLTEEQILKRTADKLKADEESHQQVRDQHDQDNRKREDEAKRAAAQAQKEAEAQQAKQDAEIHKNAKS